MKLKCGMDIPIGPMKIGVHIYIFIKTKQELIIMDNGTLMTQIKIHITSKIILMEDILILLKILLTDCLDYIII